MAGINIRCPFSSLGGTMLCCGEKMAKKGVKRHKKSSPDYRAVRFARQFFAIFPNFGAWTVATVLLS